MLDKKRYKFITIIICFGLIMFATGSRQGSAAILEDLTLEMYDLDGDGKQELFISWQPQDTYNRRLKIYKFVADGYQEIATLKYTSFALGDLDNDGFAEIAVLKYVAEEEHYSSVLEVYNFDGEGLQEEFIADFEYAFPNQVLIGAAALGQNGIFVDFGIGAHSAFTEIILKDSSGYHFVFTREDQLPDTFKPYPLNSLDINHDGILEIGMQFAPPQTEHLSMIDTPWVSHWYQWDGSTGLTKVLEEYANYGQGYRFDIPASWENQYTIILDRDDTFTITAVNFVSLVEPQAELLSIYHFPKDEWKLSDELIVIGENNDYVISIQLGDNIGDEIVNNISSVYDDFRLVPNIIPPSVAQQIIEDQAEIVIKALKNQDMEKMINHVHPIKGVRFTPYTYVEIEENLVFTKAELAGFFTDYEQYLWGNYDGTGFDIYLTPADYYQRFIYSHDFSNADQIGYNEILSSGNMIENQFEVYDNPIVVEYYFSGFNPQYGGMDWRSLRLVFEEYEDAWYLVGIISNQWTT